MIRTRPARAAAALCALAVLAGCRGGAPEGPPELVAGEHACARCGMLLTDLRFGAAARQAGASTFELFDDAGCWLAWRAERGAQGPLEVWVRDHAREGWLPAPQAFYVVGPRVGSPMGYGIAAFADEGAARRLAGERGATVKRFDELEAPAPGGEDR